MKSKDSSIHDQINPQDLNFASDILRAAHSSQEVLDFAVRIFSQLGFDRTRIWLIEKEQSKIKGAKSSHITDTTFRKIKSSLDPKQALFYFSKLISLRKPFLNKSNTILKKLIKKHASQKIGETIEFPMIVDERLIGVINVDNAITKRALDIKQMEHYMTFVNQISITFDRALLVEKLTKTKSDLQRETDALYSLRAAGESLRTMRSINDVLDFALRSFLRLGFDRVRIWQIDREKNIYRGARCSYMPNRKFQKAQDNPKAPMKSLTESYAFFQKKKKPYVNKKFPLLKKFFKDNKPTYTIEFPLIAGSKLLGVISVDNAISAREIDVKRSENTIMPFVNHIALVLNRVESDREIKHANQNLQKEVEKATLELQKKNIELEHLANHDPLSGLPNRRYFDREFNIAFRNASKQKPLTLAILDIDFLKNINDTHGHQTGDQLIKKIADILKKDPHITFAARLAGDEFVILMRQSHRRHEKIFTTLLRKIKRDTKTSVSIGVATHPNPKITSELDLMRYADDALYHAKHTGRNRYVYALNETEQVMPLTERRQDMLEIEGRGTMAIDYIRQLHALNKISEHLRKGRSETSIAKNIVRSFQKELSFNRAAFYMRGEDDDLHIIAHTKLPTSILEKINPMSRSENLSHWLRKISKKQEAAILDEKHISPWFTQNFNIRRVLFIPLIGRSSIIGAIVAEYDAEKVIQKNDLDFYLTLGDQIENGIVKIRAIKETHDFNKKLRKEVVVATKKLRGYAHSLEEQIEDNEKLREKEQRMHFELISALVTSLEEKDIYTRGHSIRVATYAVRLAREVKLSESRIANLRYAGILHDVGKVAIDQTILHKPTALTEAEAKELEKHPVIGEKIVSAVRFLKSTAHIIYHHHERWDGTGYPDRVKGKRILLESRILAIADSYDAMVTRRSYGHKMSKAEAIRELEAGSGKQFDPILAKTFVRLIKQGKIRTPNSKFVDKV